MDDVQTAKRRMDDGDASVARVRGLLNDLREGGHAAPVVQKAEELLAQLIAAQAEHVAQWKRLMGKA